MKRNLNNYIQISLNWARKNIWRIIFIIIIHILITRILDLPYINIIRTVISFTAYLVDFILVLILFKPGKKYLLYIGLWLFPLSALLALVHAQTIVEMLSNLSYLFIIAYIILSVKEMRE